MMSNRVGLLCRYQYDPLDRLVNCAPFAQATTRRFYLNGRLATEIQDTEQRSIMHTMINCSRSNSARMGTRRPVCSLRIDSVRC